MDVCGLLPVEMRPGMWPHRHACIVLLIYWHCYDVTFYYYVSSTGFMSQIRWPSNWPQWCSSASMGLLLVIRRASCGQCTWSETPTLGSIISINYPCYQTFFYWWPRFRCCFRFSLEQASPRPQIRHVAFYFQKPAENSSFWQGL